MATDHPTDQDNNKVEIKIDQNKQKEH